MAHRAVLLDTSFIIALENRDDPFHQHAQDLDRALVAEGATFVLHFGVLCEIGDGYSRLGRREKGIELLGKLVGEQGYEVFSVSDFLLAEAVELYRDRIDKDWGLTASHSYSCVSKALAKP